MKDVAFERVAEQKIREAIEAGEFDDLPNAGSRLDLDAYFALPAHLRMAFSILKSANCLPIEVELLNEVARLEAATAAAVGTDAHGRLTTELQDVRLRLAITLERHQTGTRRRQRKR